MAPAAKLRVRENPDVRRLQILDEAISVIGQRGYHGFTVQQVARRCGLTNGALLYYFGSKEQLLVSILEERDRREAEAIPQRLGSVLKTNGKTLSLAAICLSFRAIMAATVAQPELIRLHTVLQSESIDPTHPAHDYFVRREALALNEFTAALAPHCADPRATARQTYALMEGLNQQWLRTGQNFDLLAEWDKAVAMILPPQSAPKPKRSRPRRRLS